jgi:23S rRNA (cytosine1962-C5)-methyltransferase
MTLKTSNEMQYLLLDSGHGRKLEQLGPWRIERQAANAFWAPRLDKSEWKKIDAIHHRSQSGGGHWETLNAKMPKDWLVEYGPFKLKIKLTAFGHLGFFAEQNSQWAWFLDVFQEPLKNQSNIKVLNLFGYTGNSSLALAKAGFHVTHVDAAKGVVDWGKENALLNEIPDGKIRWIVDDCIDFLAREKRRGNFYHGIVLDPPSFGRGPNKQVFKIEEDIERLLRACSDILEPKPWLFHFSCHSPGFSPAVLENLLVDYVPQLKGLMSESGELFIDQKSFKNTQSLRKVPSGSFCRSYINNKSL